jgi:cysteine desulfurase
MVPVYLDNNATTRTDERVVAAMLPFFTTHFGNASSLHALGSEPKKAVREARASVQALIGAAQESEIIFTSGGTESDTSAILSALAVQVGRNEIITSAVEHPAILALLDHLEAVKGVVVHRIPVNGQGELDEAAYAAALSKRTALATLMWANNETGVIFPISRLAKAAKAVGALFHTDAVQAAGKIALDLAETEVDMASLSAHKWHGPKGIGALYLKKGVRFAPLIKGGKQERGRRAGTENIPAIVGMGEAARLARLSRDADMPRVKSLRDRLETGLLLRIPDLIVNGIRAPRLPNTLNLAFEGCDGEELLMRMDREGLAASSGSACSAGGMEPSHVLTAMGLPGTALQAVVRLSLSRETTEHDIERVLTLLPPLVERLRAKSLTPPAAAYA